MKETAVVTVANGDGIDLEEDDVDLDALVTLPCPALDLLDVLDQENALTTTGRSGILSVLLYRQISKKTVHLPSPIRHRHCRFFRTEKVMFLMTK